MPDYQIVGDMLSTLFLVGLLRIGVIEEAKFAGVDSIIMALDDQIHELCKGNSIYRHTWVTGNIRALVENGLLQTSASDDEIWANIELVRRGKMQNEQYSPDQSLFSPSFHNWAFASFADWNLA
jgi:hypothetical protein